MEKKYPSPSALIVVEVAFLLLLLLYLSHPDSLTWGTSLKGCIIHSAMIGTLNEEERGNNV